LLAETLIPANNSSMITLPRIRLWNEFWHYLRQPDKDAFGEVIQTWPPELISKLKKVIKDRFGDERFTGPSIMEAMQRLGYWPLDPVTASVLIDLGNADVESSDDLTEKLNKLARYSFYLLARGTDIRFECIRQMPRENADSLIRGLAIAEEFGYSESGGSVSLVNWSFNVFRQVHPPADWARLADWIVVHTTNPYIPFNFQRTRHQWEYSREEATSPQDTWRLVNEAEALHQKRRKERIEKEERESHARSEERENKRRNIREAHEDRKAIAINERVNICKILAELSSEKRLEAICKDESRPLAFYPDSFAEIDDVSVRNLPIELRQALIKRLRIMRRGPWRKLFVQLDSIEQH
jgi:hypothetical protein